MTRQLVAGQIVFGEEARPFSGAMLEVVLEETTFADAPAAPIAVLRREGASFDGQASSWISFELARDAPRTGARQTLRVLVDVDRDGRLSVGDYRNATSVEVPPGSVEGLIVRVRRVSRLLDPGPHGSSCK